MKTSCAMVYDAIKRHQDHLYQAHNIQPDVHITMTNECWTDLYQDPEAFHYMPLIDIHGKLDTICGHGLSIVSEQDRPFRIWVSARTQ